MQQVRGPPAEVSASMEKHSIRTTRAHPNGAAAREWDDAADYCGSDGRVAEHGEPGAHDLRQWRGQSAQNETKRRTPAREHDPCAGRGPAGALPPDRSRRASRG